MSMAPVSPWPTRNSTRELFRLAWPLILGSSIWTLQIVFDRLLLGRSDTEAVGASQIGSVIFYALFLFFQYTANYATVFVAQYTGANQPQRVGAVIGQALWFSVGSGLLFLLLIPLAKPLVAVLERDQLYMPHKTLEQLVIKRAKALDSFDEVE